MSGYLESITPDSISGAIFALEGVAGSVVLLNGPTGCKFYHSAVSDSQVIRQPEFDPLNYPAQWYFGQPRVPCTYLDSEDYVYGSKDKLEEALAFLRDRVSYSIVCIVNSPGAALIGDDLSGIARSVLGEVPMVILETPGFSGDVCAGFEMGARALIDALDPPALKPIPKSVNLLGVSLFQKYHSGDIAELRRLLDLCGVAVNCVLCAGGSPEAVGAISAASLNVVVRPEYGIKTAEYLQKRYGTPYCRLAPPIGFEATEHFVAALCEVLKTDPSGAIEDSERARAQAYPHMSRVNSLTGLPKGVRVAAEGTYSDLLAYFSFFTSYFGMIPDCAAVFCPKAEGFKGDLESFLREKKVSDALSRDIMDTRGELVFGSGATISRLRTSNRMFTGIETSLPALGYLDVIPKTHLGTRGALLLTEQILNSLMF